MKTCAYKDAHLVVEYHKLVESHGHAPLMKVVNRREFQIPIDVSMGTIANQGESPIRGCELLVWK